MTDPTIAAITDAVGVGRSGDPDTARSRLLDLWRDIGPGGDAFHRCTLAHFLADLYSDPARSLVWNVRALDAADTLTDERVRRHDAAMDVAGFYPSLHGSLADDHRRLGSFDAAREHLDAARAAFGVLGDDDYGRVVRGVVEDIERALDSGDTAPLAR